MKTCKKFQQLFIKAAYDELETEQFKIFNNHLSECPGCAAEFSQFKSTLHFMDRRKQTQPDPEFWNGYWHNLAERMDAEEKASKKKLNWQIWITHFFQTSHKWMYYPAAATALLLIGIFLGRIYFGSTELTTGYQGQFANREEMSIEKAAVNARAMHYIERSKILLLGLVNFSGDEDLSEMNFAPQQKASRNLLNQAAVLKNELSEPDQKRLRGLIQDLEVVLFQIANLEAELDLPSIELVKSGVDRRAIFLKINIEEMRNADNQTSF